MHTSMSSLLYIFMICRDRKLPVVVSLRVKTNPSRLRLTSRQTTPIKNLTHPTDGHHRPTRGMCTTHIEWTQNVNWIVVVHSILIGLLICSVSICQCAGVS